MAYGVASGVHIHNRKLAGIQPRRRMALGIAPPVISPGWGPTGVHAISNPWMINPIRINTPGSTSTTTATTTASGAPASTYPNSPVPAGYNQNSVYVDSSGAYWEYDAISGTFVNVGTPYNTGGAAAPAITSATPALPAAPTQAAAPANYIAADGSVWQYNTATLAWTEISGPTAAGVTAAAAAVGIPAVGGSQYTAADGSVWQYSATTSAWQQVSGSTVTTATTTPGGATPAIATAVTAESDYQSVLNWLTQQTLISGIPNWVLSLGIGLAAWKFMHPSTSVRGH